MSFFERHPRSGLLLTALLWSIGGLFIKMVPASGFAISSGRCLIAALTLMIAYKLPRLRITTLAQLLTVVAYAGTLGFFVESNKLTTAANAIVLQYTAPVWVALLGARIAGERARWFDWLGIAGCFAGILCFFADDLDFNNVLGLVFGLASGVSWAILVLLFRRQRSQNPISLIILGNLLLAVIGLPALLTEEIAPVGLSMLAILGVFQIAMPYLIYSVIIRRVNALDAILIPMIEPLLNPLWVILFIGERPGGWAIVGAAIVLFSLLLRSLLQRRSAPAELSVAA